MVYVVLLTGSKAWTDARPIRQHLERIRDQHPGEQLVLRHGRAKGADTIGHWIGVKLGYQPDPHPARWNAPCDPLYCRPHHRKRDRLGRLYCPAAGARRNQHMVDLDPRPAEGIAFIRNNSPGASHCVRAMRAAGIPVRGPRIADGTLPLEDV
jgi:hypothetical protein